MSITLTHLQLFPLTQAQERIWYTDILYPNTTVSILSLTVRMNGTIDLDILKQAIQVVIEENDAFRMKLVVVDDKVSQYIEPYHKQEIPIIDCTAASHELTLEDRLKEINESPMELYQSNLYDFVIFKISEHEYGYNIRMHHIISDGITIVMAVNQISENMMRLMSSVVPDRQERPSYTSYIQSEQEYMNSNRFIKDRIYWLDKWNSAPSLTGLKPYDSIVASTQSDRVSVTLQDELFSTIKAFCKQHDISLFSFFLGSFYLYVSKVTGEKDISVGTIYGNRTLKQEKQMMGMFASTVAARTLVDDEEEIVTFLQRTGKEQAHMIRHQKFPYNQFIQVLRDQYAHQDNERLFGMIMEYQQMNYEPPEHVKMDVRINSCGHESNDLVVHVKEMMADQKLEIFIDYRICLFERDEITSFINHFIAMMEQLIISTREIPNIKTSDCSILSAEAQTRMLERVQVPTADYPRESSIHHIFEAQVELTPHYVAVVHGDEELTYSELNAKANQLANVLIENGLERDQLVGILMDRSVHALVAILAILKAGGAYVPIDPSYPPDRIAFMLEDSRSTVLLLEDVQQLPCDYKGTLIVVEESMWDEKSAPNPNLDAHPNDAAYVIYTSGSTGQPKGVIAEHRNVVRLLFTDRSNFDFHHQDVWTWFHSYCFDFSVWEIFGALLFGGKLVIVPPATAKDSESFVTMLEEQQVTILNQTPTSFYALSSAACKRDHPALTIRKVIFGGEALAPSKLRSWKECYPDTQLINMYGITETTVHVTYKEITEAEIESNQCNIGQPIPTTSVYVLDEKLNVLPIGVIGELYVGGDGVTRGYLNRAELTAARFIENPFVKGERIYRTGDLGRWLLSGDLEYNGRIDDQVKIRGYRIELGEIEAELLKCDDVRACCVLAQRDQYGQNELYAYVVSAEEWNFAALKRQLSKGLPSYMIPTYFIQIDEIPYTANGKIDQKALLRVETVNPLVSNLYTAPTTDVEKQLVQIWEITLDVSSIGTQTSFFDIGGDSIKAIRVISVMNKQLQWDLQVADLYRNPTIAGLCEQVQPLENRHEHEHRNSDISLQFEEMKQQLLASGEWKSMVHEVQDVFPMSDIQQGMVYHALKDSEHSLYHDQFTYELMDSDFNSGFLQQSLAILVEKHDMLRTAFLLDQASVPLQIIYRHVTVSAESFDLRDMSAEEQEQTVKLYLKQDREQPFQPNVGPLWRLSSFQMTDDHIVLVWMFHHAILDGWSVASFITELLQVYAQLRQGMVQPRKLRSSYKDYVNEQWALQDDTEMKRYWRQELEDYKRFTLPVDSLFIAGCKTALNQTEVVQTFSYDWITKLQQVALREQTNLKTVCLAAFFAMMNGMTYEDDVTIGVVENARPLTEDADQVLGCFLHSVPFRIQQSESETWSSFIRKVHDKQVELKKYGRFSLRNIVEAVEGKKGNIDQENPIFDVLFNFVDFHIFDNLEGPSLRWGKESYERTNTHFDFSVSCTFDQMLVKIVSILPENEVKRWIGYFERIIAAIVDHVDHPIQWNELLDAGERDQLLYEFSRNPEEVEAEHLKYQSIHQWFEEQVLRTPDHTAVVFEDQTLTYSQLNERSNQLARTLRAAGVQPDELVGIMTERSLEIMVGMMGILKSGGAYVPIDPSYPQERIRYMLEDSKIRYLLSQSSIGRPASYTGHVMFIDQEETYHADSKNLDLPISTDQLAYMIYTSGTTGMPKGVMIEHASILNTIMWANSTQPFSTDDRVLILSPFVFDPFTLHACCSLVSGSTIHLMRENRKDPYHIAQEITKHKITSFESTPSFLLAMTEHFRAEDIASLKVVVVGGEKLPPSLSKKLLSLNSKLTLINEYGPTENSVVSTYSILTDSDQVITIGRPITNVQTYIMDKQNNLLPIGVPGELCLAGKGLARGYLNGPEQTALKFVNHPFDQDKKLYRTGDLVRYLPNGDIEYLGRLDDQVKVRGFRIELGEVEVALSKIDHIQEAIVVARTDSNGVKQLIGYYVSDLHLTAQQLRDKLSLTLPNYMIPASFVQVNEIPLTSNGKMDRKALPMPEITRHAAVEFVEPRTMTEEMLVSVWQSVLGIPSISITDHFFDLGGDSIKALQVSSRLYQAGFKMDMKLMFTYSTIAEISSFVEQESHSIEQGLVTGEVPLIPIQRWFFEQEKPEPHHFNQAFMLKREQGFDAAALRQVMIKIMEHHDILRSIVYETKEGYQLMTRNRDEGELFSLEVYEWSHELCVEQKIEEISNRIQSSVDMSRGPLVKLGLFKCADADHLLLVIHHLVIDMVSWRILFEDMMHAYEQAISGKEIMLPPKTDSFKSWANQLLGYANSEKVKEEQTFWEQVEQRSVCLLPKDFDYDRGIIQDLHTIELQLSKHETELLLTQAHRAYNTEINDLLLAALSLAIFKWTGIKEIPIVLEGHGREPLFPHNNFTRTVGWFTSQFPVWIGSESEMEIAKLIKNTKERLRSIPNKGIGYGILRYLSMYHGMNRFQLNPEIGFNYLGQMDEDFKMNAIEESSFSGGKVESDYNARPYVLDILGVAKAEQLSLMIGYSHKQYQTETMVKFSRYLLQSLQEIIEHCMTRSEAVLTPSDISLKGITIDELDDLLNQIHSLEGDINE